MLHTEYLYSAVDDSNNITLGLMGGGLIYLYRNVGLHENFLITSSEKSLLLEYLISLIFS